MAEKRDKGEHRVPKRRTGAVRVTQEAARRLREGHPWVYRPALAGRELPKAGAIFDVIGPDSGFIGRAVNDPEGPVALRVFSYEQGKKLDAQAISGSVRRALALRSRLGGDVALAGPACFRLLNGDCEGVPAVNADRYGDYIVVQVYAQMALDWHQHVVDALADALSPKAIYLQHRYRNADKKAAELVYGDAAPLEVVVTENGLRFVVDVTAPLGTGLFADMRGGRRSVARLSAGQRVLNCFSYTGAFSVVAAVHGATQVVSVDLSARAHSRARRNFKENNLDPEAEQYEFVTADIFASLTRFADEGRRFDLVILDPPSFSTAKGRVFTTVADYAELSQLACNIIAPGGMLVAACNTARMSSEDFEKAVGRGVFAAERHLLIHQRFGQGPDYPSSAAFDEGRYLKVVVGSV